MQNMLSESTSAKQFSSLLKQLTENESKQR